MRKLRLSMFIWLLVLTTVGSLSGVAHGLLHEHGPETEGEDFCPQCLPAEWSVEVDACAPQVSRELVPRSSETPRAAVLEQHEDDAAHRGRAPPSIGRVR